MALKLIENTCEVFILGKSGCIQVMASCSSCCKVMTYACEHCPVSTVQLKLQALGLEGLGKGLGEQYSRLWPL